MTFNEDAPFQALRQTWQPVSNAADLPTGKVIGYTLLDQELVIARFHDGTLLAADVACPHKGARLSAGRIDGDCLMCPYHGWRFGATGDCQSIPSLIEPNPKKCDLSHLRTYDIQDRYGMIWVKLDRDSDAVLPEVPEFENAEWSYRLGPPMVFKAGFRREVENYLDMTHFAFAHGTTLGKAAGVQMPEMDITIHDNGFQMDAPFPALETPHEQPGKLQSAHHRQQRCHLPNFTTIRQTFTDGDERVLVHIPSPNTRESCTVFWSLAISPRFDGPEPDSQIDFAIKVLEEDRDMCELQIPAEIPLNPTRGGWGVLVTPGDTLANTFQKTFRQWLQKQISPAPKA